jgi:hypothetical protein
VLAEATPNGLLTLGRFVGVDASHALIDELAELGIAIQHLLGMFERLDVGEPAM